MFAALLERLPSTWAPAHEIASAVWSRLTADAIRVAQRFRRAKCGLGGHAMVLHFEPHKMSLRCMNCGEQTPGWAIHDGNDLRMLGIQS